MKGASTQPEGIEGVLEEVGRAQSKTVAGSRHATGDPVPWGRRSQGDRCPGQVGALVEVSRQLRGASVSACTGGQGSQH